MTGRAQRILAQSRGRELPGNFNPLLISELFWQQSEKWEAFASEHLHSVSEHCAEFVEILQRSICPVDMLLNLRVILIDGILQERTQAGQDELKRLLFYKKRHPMTYSHYYTITIQKRRKQDAKSALLASFDASTQLVVRYDSLGRRSDVTETNKDAVRRMSDSEVRDIAVEPEDVTSQRESLENLKQALEKSRGVFAHTF